MARLGWDSLTPEYRGRLSRKGITKTSYERGDSITVARGHAHTPEHGIGQALNNPARYRSYLNKKNVPVSVKPLTPDQEASKINSMLDKAYRNIHRRLGFYFKYNDANVKANVYGGIGGSQLNGEENIVDRKGMSYVEALWTSTAGTEELRSRASEQLRGNPWFYH